MRKLISANPRYLSSVSYLVKHMSRAERAMRVRSVYPSGIPIEQALHGKEKSYPAHQFLQDMKRWMGAYPVK